MRKGLASKPLLFVPTPIVGTWTITLRMPMRLNVLAVKTVADSQPREVFAILFKRQQSRIDIVNAQTGSYLRPESCAR